MTEAQFIDKINSSAETKKDWAARNRREDSESHLALIEHVRKILIGEETMDEAFLGKLSNNTYEARGFLEDGLQLYYDEEQQLKDYWSLQDPLIKFLIREKYFNQDGSPIRYIITHFIARRFNFYSEQEFEKLIQFLADQGFTESDIISICLISNTSLFKGRTTPSRRVSSEELTFELSNYGKYLLPRLEDKKSGFLGLNKQAGRFKEIDQLLLDSGQHHKEQILNWLQFLHFHYPQGIRSDLSKYLVFKEYNGHEIYMKTAVFLINHRLETAEQALIAAIEKTEANLTSELGLYYLLSEKLNGKYNDRITKLSEQNLDFYTLDHSETKSHWESSVLNKAISNAYFDFLYQQDPKKAVDRFTRFVDEATFVPRQLIGHLRSVLDGGCLPFIMQVLKKEIAVFIRVYRHDYYNSLFSILEDFDVKDYLEDITDFLIHRANKRIRALGAALLAKYPELIKDRALQLLESKVLNERITGAMILSNWPTNEMDQKLDEVVDEEKSDDTRDIILEALQEKRFSTPYAHEQVIEMVSKAQQRKKLSRWSEKWLEEDQLPKLCFKNGEQLAQEHIRFLFYRMRRSKEMSPDIEAKQLIHQLDKSTSGDFAKKLLSAFQESNADSKFKYYMALAGLIGDEEMTSKLNTLFNKSVAEKRMKMATHVIGTLAMVGTNRALRSLDAIHRKFLNKRPQVRKAAQEALEAAAVELGISQDQLSDRIIPNFDFDGLYMPFDVDGEEHRAFVAADFKLNFMNEDNKIRKSPPPGTDAALKKQFKEIEKEIRDVNKTQPERLEKAMVDERKWNATEWHEYFFEHPIMFNYTLKLLWGKYDKDGQLVDTFYCSEDTGLYDLNDEEIEIDENDLIGILHPMQLTHEQQEQWKDKLYEVSFVSLFPQMERSYFQVPEEELDKHYTKMYFGRKVPKGADHCNTFMVRRKWEKSSGDGARSIFQKRFGNGQFTADASIEGPAAYYLGGNTPAQVFEVYFFSEGSSEKVKLRDIPKVFFSEVMYDIELLIQE